MAHRNIIDSKTNNENPFGAFSVIEPQETIQSEITQGADPSFIEEIIAKLPESIRRIGEVLKEGLIGRGQEVDIAGELKFDTGLIGFIRPFGIGKSKAEKASDRIDLLKPLVEEGTISPKRAEEIVLDVVQRERFSFGQKQDEKELILTSSEKSALRPVVIEEALDKLFGALDFVSLGLLKPITRTAASQIAKSKSVNKIIDILSKEIPDLPNETKETMGKALVQVNNADDVQTVLNRTELAVQEINKARGVKELGLSIPPKTVELQKSGIKIGGQTFKQIDKQTKDELAEAIDYIRTQRPKPKPGQEVEILEGFNRKIETNIGLLAEKFNITTRNLNEVASKFDDLFANTQTVKIPVATQRTTKGRKTKQVIRGEQPKKITKGEDVLLKKKLTDEARGAKTAVAQFKREEKFLGGIEKDITRVFDLRRLKNVKEEARLLNKVRDEISRSFDVAKGKERSKISFTKELGEFKRTALLDAREKLGIEKPIKQMNLEELKSLVTEMKTRLAFKRDRGFRPSKETVEKLGIKAPDSKQPVISDEMYKKNIQVQKRSTRTRTKDIIQSVRDEVDKTLGTISSRLADIDPSLRVQLRKFIFNTTNKTIKDKKVVIPLLEKLGDMTKEDFSIFDFATKNGDITKQNELISKYGMQKEMDQTRKLLDGLYDDANDVGFDIGYRKDYFPRMLKDPEGLVQFFSETNSPVRSIIAEAIGRKERDLGRELTINEMAYLINNMIRGYSGGQITLAPLGSMKNRIIDFVTPELNKFYHDTSATLLMYIDSTNRAIEARKFFGKSRIVDKKVDQFNNIEDSIGGYVTELLADGKIVPKQELELREILNAFFGEKGTHGVVSLYKNLSYLDVMGSPINALTQIGDLAFPIYNVGVGNAGTFDTVEAFARAIFGKSKITKEDIGIEKIAAEFESTTKSANAVDVVFKVIGLTKVDAIGKETLINPVVARYQALGKNPTPEFTKEMKLVFEDDAEQVIKELASGVITKNVKFLAFYKLLDFQPVAKSEVPQRYLTGGNARIFYQLKTWTLKMFDVFRNEGFRTMQTDKPRGIRNIIVLAMALTTTNATADEIKDLVLGRKTALGDRIVDNMVKLIGFSRYSVNQIARDGLGTAITEQILPPKQAVDNISKDLVKLYKDWDTGIEVNKLKSLKSIPGVGNLYYWWFGKGADFKDQEKEVEITDARRVRKRESETNVRRVRTR